MRKCLVRKPANFSLSRLLASLLPHSFTDRFLTPSLLTLSFLFSLPLIQPFELARLAAVAFAMLALAASFAPKLSGPGLALPKAPLILFLLLFWALAGISIFWSSAVNLSVEALCTLSLLPLGFFALAAQDDEKIFTRIFAVAGVILAALALWVPIQYFFFPEILQQGGVRFPFADSNAYAAALSLGFFPALGLAASGASRRARGFALALSILCLCAIIILASRSAVLGLVGGVLVFVFLVRARLRALWRQGAVLAAAGCFTAALMALMPMAGRTNPVRHLANIDSSVAGSLQARLDLWRATLAMIRDHLFTGTGIGTYLLYYPQYRLPGEWASAGLMAHSDPLQFMAEMGLAAPALFYLVLAAAGWRMMRAMKALPLADERRTMLAALFCGSGALLFHSHVSFNLYVASLLSLAGFMLAWWLRLTVNALPGEAAVTLKASRPAVAWGIVLMPLAAFLFVAQGFFISSYLLTKAKAEALGGDMAAFAANVNAANAASFGMDGRAYTMAVSVPLGILENPGVVLPDAEKQKLAAQIEALLDKASRANARLVEIPYNRAKLAIAQKKIPEAAGFLREAVRLNPQHLPSRMLLADIYARQGNQDAEMALLKDGLPWFYALQDPREYYARTMLLAVRQNDGQAHELAARMEKRARAYWAAARGQNPPSAPAP